MFCYCDQDLLSFVGNGFFSAVSVFFNFDLSNFVTSPKSGLSPILVRNKLQKHKTRHYFV